MAVTEILMWWNQLRTYRVDWKGQSRPLGSRTFETEPDQEARTWTTWSLLGAYLRRRMDIEQVEQRLWCRVLSYVNPISHILRLSLLTDTLETTYKLTPVYEKFSL